MTCSLAAVVCGTRLSGWVGDGGFMRDALSGYLAPGFCGVLSNVMTYDR